MRMQFSQSGKSFSLIFTRDEFHLALSFLRSLQGNTLQDEALVDQVRNQLERKPPTLTVVKGGVP